MTVPPEAIVVVWLALAAASAPVCAQSDHPFNGSWTISFDGRRTADLEGTVVVQGDGGSWDMVAQASKNPCVGRPYPITVRKASADELVFTVNRAATLPGCKDSTYTFKKVDDKTLLAHIWVYDPPDEQGIPASSHQIPLGGADVTDTGYSTFHSDTGNGIACASCHAEGTDDGHVWNFLGLGGRRTQPLDVGLEGSAPFHWDGTLPSFDDLVHEVFQRRMGAQEQSPARIGALERYIFGFRRRPAGLFDDEAAARGQHLFESAEVGCAECHSGPKFTNGLSESIGKGNAMQVPSLVAVAARAPYMHDGCAATLRDRFDPACGGTRHGNTAQLNDAELNDLLLELNGLYSEMGQKSVTDFDEHNYHNNEIASVIERRGAMVFYQMEKDWHYRKEERRWTALNDNSAWHKVERVGSRTQRSVFHIR